MAAPSEATDDASQRNCPAAVVDAHECQEMRSIFSRLNLLDPTLRIGELENGKVAIPLLPDALRSFPQSSNHDSCNFCVEGKEFIIGTAKLPLAKRTKVQGPRQRLIKALRALLESKDLWQEDLLQDVPRRWQRHGDMVVITDQCFANPIWETVGHELLWNSVARALSAQRVARQRAIQPDGYRSPQVELMVGEEAWVEHVDNGIRYGFDVTRNMFSKGNITEKLRIAKFACQGETVVDMFAGIGYFTLPYLIHARADTVHACEWNPEAVKALKRNLAANNVENRCIVHEGDCQQVSPINVADRVNLGLVPSSEVAWQRACQALRLVTGGWLHVHGNVDSAPSRDGRSNQCDADECHGGETGATAALEKSSSALRKQDIWHRWAESTRMQIRDLLHGIHGQYWNVTVEHIEHVKSYAAHVDHLVLDLECRPPTKMLVVR